MIAFCDNNNAKAVNRDWTSGREEWKSWELQWPEGPWTWTLCGHSLHFLPVMKMIEQNIYLSADNSNMIFVYNAENYEFSEKDIFKVWFFLLIVNFCHYALCAIVHHFEAYKQF